MSSIINRLLVNNNCVCHNASTHFISLPDSLPDCSSSVQSEPPIAENTCGVAPDIVSLSCSVRYSGVVAPVLKWMDIGGRNHSQNTRGGSHEVVNTVRANATWNNCIYKCLSVATGKSCYTVIPKPTCEYTLSDNREKKASLVV